jgi:hypothetical protein
VTTRLESKTPGWEERLRRLLPLFGHRNWIVVADSAYPAQSNPGIETIYTGDEHIRVLEKVVEAINASAHIQANIYLDAELKHVPEVDVPGVSALRDEIGRLLSGRNTRVLEHEQIIAKLDESAKLFSILILKSTLAIPYTSVFLELDCGYWNREAEKRLRDSIADKPAAASGD